MNKVNVKQVSGIRYKISDVKVSLIHHTISPYRHPLFENLAKLVDLMVYYCSVRGSSRKWDLWPKNYSYKYKVLPKIPFRISIEGFGLNPLIVKEIIKNRPHILILSDYTDLTVWLAFVTAKKFGVLIIYWTEGIREPPSILGAITRPLRRLLIKHSSAIIVPGKLSARHVISLGANRRKVFVAPNAIDNDLFVNTSHKYKLCTDELKAQLGFKGKIVILYVGQLIRRKGIEYLLHAYGKLKREYNDTALVLIGSGSLEFHLKDLAYSLELKDLKFIQSGLSLDNLIKFYSAADIFVLPTLEDIWGFVINEAMVCGLPTIATRSSQAAQEMIRPRENGCIVREADTDELYEALKKLVCDAELRKKMAKKSEHVAVSEFDVGHMVRGFKQALNYSMSFGREQEVTSDMDPWKLRTRRSLYWQLPCQEITKRRST